MPDAPDRTANVANQAKIKERLEKLYDKIVEGFQDEANRSRMIGEYWDIYNCLLGTKQAYNGNSEIYVPAVYQSIQARVTRFTNQIFPFNGRHIEALSTDASTPRARTALGEHYIRKSGLKSVAKQFLVNKDVEGHGWLYTSWGTRKRNVIDWRKQQVSIDVGPVGEVSVLREGEVEDAYPVCEVLSDGDVLVLPATADTLEGALEDGGCFAIQRRWSKEKIKSLMDDGLIDKAKGDKLMRDMSVHNTQTAYSKDRAKQSLYAAGIKGAGRGKYALVFQVYTMLDLPEGRRICECFFSDRDNILHAHRNPLWSDLLPLIGCPGIKVPGAHKGRSPTSTVSTLQYFINDIANLGADSATRGMVPITLTDPSENPRYETMKLAQGAVWLTNPRSTEILKFPEMWKDAGAIIQSVDGIIKTTLGVNPSMMAQYQRAGKQPNQALVAQEHAVDLLTTAFEVTSMEEEVLSPWLRLVMEMDKQYRDEMITVESFGEMGMEAIMQELPPLQEDKKCAYVWYGVEQVRNEQRMQTQLGLVNIVKGIPPQMYQGYMMDIAPALVSAFDSVFGPRVGRQVFKDIRGPLTTNPELENQLMDEGHDMPVHVLDPHPQHMQSHVKSMQEEGDATGNKARHLAKHQIAMASNARAQQEAASPQTTPGPRTGARPSGVRPNRQTPGAVRQTQIPLAQQKQRNVGGRLM